jgi:UDP-N-acetylglucosamine:LPS N-acetylglucosamine transferase
MDKTHFVVVTDRGGHLHNALMLLEQLSVQADAIVTTYGPDIKALSEGTIPVYSVPHLFKWYGKLRVLNPLYIVGHLGKALNLALKLRPRKVVSLGASNVVPFCFFAKLLGAEIYHVECMNQVKTPSVTARMLYPIADKIYVQWEELLPQLGSKAVFAGWVL